MSYRAKELLDPAGMRREHQEELDLEAGRLADQLWKERRRTLLRPVIQKAKKNHRQHVKMAKRRRQKIK